MKDILYKDLEISNYIEKLCEEIFISYGFYRISTPILEMTELFNRSMGEVSEIVNKEMYTFLDRRKRSISLRPEGTSSCLRAIIENNLDYNKNLIKLWYCGPMFRYERPQKGRLRQFHQIGVEIFGSNDIYIEIELILMIRRLLKKLQISDTGLRLYINNIGDSMFRERYKKILKEYLNRYHQSINKDIKKTINNNILRIFDIKDKSIKNILREAPKITDYLEYKNIYDLNKFKQYLKELDIDFFVDKTLVRGLDYYNGNIFEYKSTFDDYNLTIFAGGRYNNLINMIYRNKLFNLPAVGLALGLERLILYIKFLNIDLNINPRVYKISFIILKNSIETNILKLSEDIRDELLYYFKNLQIIYYIGNRSLKKHLSCANKNNIDLVILIGSDEIRDNLFTIRDLSKGLQFKVKRDEIVIKIKEILSCI